jgi:hypothetical protein
MARKYFLGVILYVLFLALNSGYTFAQKGSSCPEDLIPKYSQTSKLWGFSNLFGQWVINPIYSKVSPYVENMAVVQKGSKFGVIDCEGNVILHVEYERLTNFRNGKIWVRKNGLWSLLNAKGQTLVPPEYMEINPIAMTELTWVRSNTSKLWGLFNEEKGAFICRPQFKVAQIMSENATLVQIVDLYGVINHVNCNYLLPLNISKVKKVAPHIIIYQSFGKWGIFNEQGKIAANAIYDTISVKYNEILMFRKEGLYGLIALNGKELTKAQFEEIGDFSDGFFRVKQKGKYGYSSKLGKIYIKPMYEDASSFQKSKAVVKQEGKYGIIDVRNKFILAPSFSFIDRDEKAHYFRVREKDPLDQKDKLFLYGLDMKKVSPKGYDTVYISDQVNLVRVKNDGKFNFFSIADKMNSISGDFEDAKAFKNGYAFVKNNGKWGAVDEKGKQVIPFSYDSLDYEWFQKALMFRSSLNGKLGILDLSGKVVIPNEYELIATALPNYLKVKKSGKWGVIRTTGGPPLVDFLYDHISNKIDDPIAPEWPAIVQKKDKFGLMNEKGEIIYEPKALVIDYVGEGMFAVKEKKTFGVLNSKASNEYTPQFDQIEAFGNGLAAARKGNKWGYIDKAGLEAVKPQFEEAGQFFNYIAAVKVGGKWGVIDPNGKFLVPPDYNEYKLKEDGSRKLYKDGKEFSLNNNGTLR